jgi:hypothetical protein
MLVAQWSKHLVIMHKIIGSNPAVIHFFWLRVVHVNKGVNLYILSTFHYTLCIYVNIPVVICIYMSSPRTYTLNMVHTCIKHVYTFEILYMNVCTCHIQCHTTYIILYTLYMSIYAVYIIYLNITVPLAAFFNSQALSGHIRSCQQVSSHKLCKYIAMVQLLLHQHKPVHPFQTKV